MQSRFFLITLDGLSSVMSSHIPEREARRKIYRENETRTHTHLQKIHVCTGSWRTRSRSPRRKIHIRTVYTIPGMRIRRQHTHLVSIPGSSPLRPLSLTCSHYALTRTQTHRALMQKMHFPCATRGPLPNTGKRSRVASLGLATDQYLAIVCPSVEYLNNRTVGEGMTQMDAQFPGYTHIHIGRCVV